MRAFSIFSVKRNAVILEYDPHPVRIYKYDLIL